MEHQDLSRQLVSIPALIPSGFWDHSLLFTCNRQCVGEASAQSISQSPGWAWRVSVTWRLQKGILRAKCIKREGRHSRHPHPYPNEPLDQELTPSRLTLQPSKVAECRRGNNDRLQPILEVSTGHTKASQTAGHTTHPLSTGPQGPSENPCSVTGL